MCLLVSPKCFVKLDVGRAALAWLPLATGCFNLYSACLSPHFYDNKKFIHFHFSLSLAFILSCFPRSLFPFLSLPLSSSPSPFPLLLPSLSFSLPSPSPFPLLLLLSLLPPPPLSLQLLNSQSRFMRYDMVTEIVSLSLFHLQPEQLSSGFLVL